MNSGLQSKKILVAPLDWGLGHAARCIPLVNELIRVHCEVWIASGGGSLHLLRKEFPLLPFIEIRSHRVIYHSAKSGFRWAIARQMPALLASIRRERRWLEKVMDEHHFDIIISDNRYGLHTPKAHAVMITHQLAIKTGMGVLADWLIRKLNYRLIGRFDECWVPDFAGVENLAGALSHPATLPPHTRYIGAISRFVKAEHSRKYDLLILLSGPEPRRSIWEQLLLAELSNYTGKVLMVRGLPDDAGIPVVPAGTKIVNFLPAASLGSAIQQAEWVICRSGYTSVMDLVHLEHKAILVPTPGQPEQEYLAQWLLEKGIFYTCPEAAFSLNRCLREAANFPFRFSGFRTLQATCKNHIENLLTLKG